MSIFAKAAAFARSPQGKRLMRQVTSYARSPEGRKRIQRAVETARSPQTRQRVADARARVGRGVAARPKKRAR